VRAVTKPKSALKKTKASETGESRAATAALMLDSFFLGVVKRIAELDILRAAAECVISGDVQLPGVCADVVCCWLCMP